MLSTVSPILTFFFLIHVTSSEFVSRIGMLRTGMFYSLYIIYMTLYMTCLGNEIMIINIFIIYR